MDRLYKIKTSGMFIYFRIHILGKLLHIGTGYVCTVSPDSNGGKNKENGELYNTAITATAGTATIAVIFAVPLTVSFATVFAVSLAIFFTAFLKSFLPASTFLMRFRALPPFLSSMFSPSFQIHHPKMGKKIAIWMVSPNGLCKYFYFIRL